MYSDDKNHEILRWVISFLALCWLLLAPAVVTAQSQDASATASDEDDACLLDANCTEMYTNARRLSQAGQYEAALVAYQSAYVLSKEFWLLVNVGRMQQKIGRPQQAIATYRELLEEDYQNLEDSETRNKAREYMRQAEREILAQQAVMMQTKPILPARPVYKKGWFWVAIGGAAVAASMIAVGLVVGTRTADRAVRVPANTLRITF